MKKLDLYIIRKFLGTFFFSMVLILSIVVVFDLSERLEKFIENEAPVKAIIFDYYLNFVPYFANVFSSLFTFISVIFFTSKMAYNSEIIAILSTGISFRRMVRPYMISAGVIALLSLLLSAFIIPNANKKRIEFSEQYIWKKYSNKEENIHRQIVEQRSRGKAVLLISLELDEVMNLSDRILVMYEGEIVGEFDPKTTTVQELGLYMAGARKQGKE